MLFNFSILKETILAVFDVVTRVNNELGLAYAMFKTVTESDKGFRSSSNHSHDVRRVAPVNRRRFIKVE